jgi:hypothetical protein
VKLRIPGGFEQVGDGALDQDGAKRYLSQSGQLPLEAIPLPTDAGKQV